jgi:hypothetical protein
MNADRKEKLMSQLKELKSEFHIKQERNKKKLEEIDALRLKLNRLKQEHQLQAAKNSI